MLFEDKELNLMFYASAFLLILILAAVVLLFIVFNTRKNTLIKENLKAALKNQKRQHELELKALRGQMNPHFVHNSLNAIQYYIQKNDVETSENYLAKFSKLMRQFFEYSRRKNIRVSEEINLLKNYLYIEQLRFEDKLTYAIKIDKKLDIDETYIPSMLLQPLVENAINHGLFHKQGKGHITIIFTLITPTCYEVQIIDDGIGIHKAKAIHSTIKNDTESHSSAVMEERLHFLKQSSPWDVTFSIEDRSIKENISGTKVSLTIKNDDYDQD